MESDNSLDYLLSLLDPRDHDIDEIIDRMRKARANYDAGGKPEKERPKVDLSSVMAKLVTPVPEKPKLRRI